MDTVIAWFTANPLAIGVAILILLIIIGVLANGGKHSRRDPQRMFTSKQREEGFSRANGRCELDGFLLFRCRRAAEHGDHFLPWSKGGASSMGNFVAACSRCNLAKSAKMPSGMYGRRIARRRRRYFPAAVPLKAGQWVDG